MDLLALSHWVFNQPQPNRHMATLLAMWSEGHCTVSILSPHTHLKYTLREPVTPEHFVNLLWISKDPECLGLERSLNGYEHLLLFWWTWSQFAAPTWHVTSICNSSSRDMTSSSDLLGHQAHMWYTDIHTGKFHIQTKE